ncbi:hypothetical protein [Streptomyces sp. NPDC050145]|uniref:hypothetical protein n=1 Tax=Streptomyces sp. NPDC050145 TaxID=3365602 RepID=UPI0037A10835
MPRTGGNTIPSTPSAQSSATPHGTPAAGTATSSSLAPSLFVGEGQDETDAVEVRGQQPALLLRARLVAQRHQHGGTPELAQETGELPLPGHHFRVVERGGAGNVVLRRGSFRRCGFFLGGHRRRFTDALRRLSGRVG